MSEYRTKKIRNVKTEIPAGNKALFGSHGRRTTDACWAEREVCCVDDAGQIHVQWENGSTLALNTEVDQFHKQGMPEKKREKGEPSR